MVPNDIWHNTGGNGRAREVWVRRVGKKQADINVMSYRVMVDLWIGPNIAEEGVPFATLDGAKAYADRFLAAPFGWDSVES